MRIVNIASIGISIRSWFEYYMIGFPESLFELKLPLQILKKGSQQSGLHRGDACTARILRTNCSTCLRSRLLPDRRTTVQVVVLLEVTNGGLGITHISVPQLPMVEEDLTQSFGALQLARRVNNFHPNIRH